MAPSDEETSLTTTDELTTDETTTDERSDLARVTAEAGWQRRVDDRVDVYVRGGTRIRVIWRGNHAISGGSRYLDDALETYSRDLATVKGWLAR